jgi:hypothetical protein
LRDAFVVGIQLFYFFSFFYDCIMQAFRRIDGVLSSFYSLYH